MASRYWVGGSANWDGTAGTKWALTSGGTGGQAVPTSTDDVFFDAASGAAVVPVRTVSAVCNNLDFTGFTGTFTASSLDPVGTKISGSLTLVAGMTFSNSNLPFQFIATSTGKTITMAGKSFVKGVVFNGVGGGWTLQDTFNVGVGTGSSGISLTSGALDLNGKQVTGELFSLTGATARSLTFNGATVIVGSTNSAGKTIWNAAVTTNLTFIPDSGTIKLIPISASSTFAGGGLTYNNLWILPSGTAATTTITGANTFADFKIDSSTVATTVAFTNATTQTVTTFHATGSSGKVITINSDTTAAHTLSAASGTISCDWLNIQHSVATGGATWYAGANSTNNQAVATAGSGWIFTAPPSTANGRFLMFM